MSKFSRWFNSKTGKRTIAGVLALALVVVIVGQLANWWNLIPGTGTVIVPPPEPYPAPEGGYTCLPTCAENDGKFLLISGQDMATFAGAKVVVWISVPADYTSFTLDVFDGDAGKDNNGNMNYRSGNWDDVQTETIYSLFFDPLKNNGGPETPFWTASSNDMSNNAWYSASIDNQAGAKSPSGHYFYRLEVTQPTQDVGGNAFKLRSNAYLSTGRNDTGEGRDDLTNASFAVVGQAVNINDLYLLHPQNQGLFNLGPSTYTGEWNFHFYLPNSTTYLEIWNGDFDRGTSTTVALDTDDPNTDGIPMWADPSVTVPEGQGGKGAPADDSWSSLFRRDPAVWYEIIDPNGQPIFTDDEPSGTEEWERFSISNDPATQPDMLYTDGELPAGRYTFHIVGLDIHNLIFIRTSYEICDAEDGCGPPPWPEGNCPRTIGYWKNNVSKVLAGRTNGVQESLETLTWALQNVANASPLYRSGLNATLMDPEPIANAVPLTLEEAEVILQRSKKDYPGDEQSMMARALQQNLATWLNLGSGKVGPTTVVELNVAGGVFEGTLMEALEEAQTIIFNATSPDDPALERAKDIGDQINNGLLGEDAGDSVCEDYITVIPPDKQPPEHKNMPKAPVPPEPPMPTPEPTPDPNACQLRLNNYGVEKMTNNPFYGIKFEYQSGTEIKNGESDEYKITLTAEEAASLTAIQMEAKAGQNVGIVTLEADFTSPLPSGEPVMDENGYFGFYFGGATDNGDGTLTLTFIVQNFTSNATSHVTIGLPDGMVPSQPDGPYQSRVCPSQ
ncbi:MAG: hypothetical protein JXR84_27425 [Anaerolineae bacterium]|nr:hypothetical protein [Anaerolineae bacterium]